MKRDLLTPGEASVLLSVHRKTLARWHEQGKIRAVVTDSGHRRYVAVDDMGIFGRIRAALWTRRCRGGCGSTDYHTHHLTRFGMRDLARAAKRGLT